MDPATPPDPRILIEVALEPRSETDAGRLRTALERLCAEDRSFRASIDLESGQTVLGGLSEPDLDRLVGRLIHEEGIDLACGAAQVAYRETLRRRAEIDYALARPSGPTPMFARVKLVFEPAEPGSGCRFDNLIHDGASPEVYIAAVRKGLEAARDNGLLAGFPVIDFTATLVEAIHHDQDSSEMAFEIAARGAFRELREKGAPVLLEPIMTVEVTAPVEDASMLAAELAGRRGNVEGSDVRDGRAVITAEVPLANMFGYDEALRQMTQGRAKFTMAFSRYEPIDGFEPPDGPFAPAAALRA